MMSSKRWLPILQWGFLLLLTAFALFNSATDHGIQMAINCICIGFLFAAMLAARLVELRYRCADETIAAMSSARDQFTRAVDEFMRAVNEGRVEVVVRGPPDDDDAARPTMLH